MDGKKESAKELVSKLKVIAETEGCSVEDLVAKYSGEEEEGGGEEGSDEKVNLIAARMKASHGEDY